MTKIYIVVEVYRCEGYSGDDPAILFVSDNYEKAKSFFNHEISTYEDDLENFDSNFDSNCEEHLGETKLVYECVAFDGDTHRIMKLVEKEIQ